MNWETESLTANKAIGSEFKRETLSDLISDKLAAIHVKGFYPKDVAQKVARVACDHPELGHYKKNYNTVARVCTPHIDQRGDPEAGARYHDEAVTNIQAIRCLFSPFMTPVDALRVLLDEMWPLGASIQRLNRRTCFVGALRVFFKDISSFRPHHDRLEEETSAPEAVGICQQLVANVYLEMPETGGDLQLWRREATPRETIQIRNGALLASDIEPPCVVIHPEVGDLIIFSSRHLHAVTPSNGSNRVGMAAFIGCYGENRPLTYWS